MMNKRGEGRIGELCELSLGGHGEGTKEREDGENERTGR